MTEVKIDRYKKLHEINKDHVPWKSIIMMLLLKLTYGAGTKYLPLNERLKQESEFFSFL